jgi:hypothetical protein
MANPKEPVRKVKTRQDLGAIEAIEYNDAAGAKKIIIVEPPVLKAVGASENVGPGRLVKVTGTSYTLDLLGKAYDSGATYQKGDIVSETASVYMALEDGITGAFDVSKWKKVADKQVGPVTITAGSIVSTGRWHNTVTGAGFLVDDESYIPHTRVRD